MILNTTGTKKISNKKYLLGVICMILFVGVLNRLNILQNVKIILYIITGTLFYKLSYKDGIYKCMITNLLFWLGLILAEAVSICIVVWLNDLDNIKYLLNGNIFRIEAIIISKSLIFLEFILFKYFRLLLDFKSRDMTLIGIPIFSNILSLLLIFEYNFNQNIISENDILILILAVFFVILSSIVLLIIIKKIIDDEKIKLEYELVNER